MIRSYPPTSPRTTWLEAPLRPFILIDTRIVGGPGKGLFQFLRHAPREAANRFEPTLAHFTYPDGALTEFERRAGELGIPRVSIETSAPFDRTTLRHALALIRARGANIIQSHGYKSHLYAFILRRLTGIPWVAFAHGWTAEDLKVRLYHLIDRAVLPSADTVVAVSSTLHRMIARWRGGERPTELI